MFTDCVVKTNRIECPSDQKKKRKNIVRMRFMSNILFYIRFSTLHWLVRIMKKSKNYKSSQKSEYTQNDYKNYILYIYIQIHIYIKSCS